ncbi:MAG: hypothetical protein JWM28_3395, partial [Chitinophagaceae bacterium]|nr:hypothetical protein [Chitinophagaceae bacterium]
LSVSQISHGDTLHLLLYRLLRVKTIKDDKGHDVVFRQAVTSFSDQELLQVNAVNISLNSFSSTQEGNLVIEYEGFLKGYTETGMSYIKDNISPIFTILRTDSYSYPVQGVPSRMQNNLADLPNFDYRVAVTVPDSLVVVNGGKLLSKSSHDGISEYVFQNRKPAWRIDVTIGKYSCVTSGIFSVFYFPGDSLGANKMINHLKSGFSLLSNWFGNVPDSGGYSIIEIPDNWGSQADVSCIIQTASAFKNENRMYELYHELSHIWNVKTIDKSPCRLESEGLAMLLQYLMLEKLNQRQGYVDSLAQKTFEKVKKRFETDQLAVSTPIMAYGEKQISDLSYTKGMLFFYILYKDFGEKRFISTVRNFYQHFRTTGAGIHDFSGFLASELQGDKIKTIINDWIVTSASSQKIMNEKSVKDLVM